MKCECGHSVDDHKLIEKDNDFPILKCKKCKCKDFVLGEKVSYRHSHNDRNQTGIFESEEHKFYEWKRFY